MSATEGFEQFAAGLDPAIASHAFASEGLATAYWLARRAGHSHVAITGAARGIANADNPVAVIVTRLRRLAATSPPGGSSKHRSHLDPHQPCPDAHPDCVLCLCDPRASAHHVATPMPDWLRQAWNELRVARTGLIP